MWPVFLILAQLLIFVVLLVMLRSFLNRNIVSATRHLEEMSKEYAQKEQRLQEEVEKITQEAGLIKKKAEEDAEALRRQVLQQAEKEKEAIINQARQQAEEIIRQAERSRKALLAEIEDKINAEAIKKAYQLIAVVIPDDFRYHIHEYWFNELMKEGIGRWERLHLAEDTKEVKVISAFALTAVQRQQIIQMLKGVLGQDFEISLQEDIDPALIAGLVIKMGNIVCDGSLRHRFDEEARHG